MPNLHIPSKQRTCFSTFPKNFLPFPWKNHNMQWECMGMPCCQEYFEYTPGVLRSYVKPKHLDALTFTLQPVIEAGNNHPIEPGHWLFVLHEGSFFSQSSCNDHWRHVLKPKYMAGVQNSRSKGSYKVGPIGIEKLILHLRYEAGPIGNHAVPKLGASIALAWR